MRSRALASETDEPENDDDDGNEHQEVEQEIERVLTHDYLGAGANADSPAIRLPDSPPDQDVSPLRWKV